MRASTRKALRDYGIAILAAVTVALFIRFFVVEAYRIPTSAMRPTLEPGDTIFVAKSPLGFNRSSLALGDVVVFESPTEPGRDYIKRVLGIAGDTIQVVKGHVVRNGGALDPASADKNALCGDEKLGNSRYQVCWEPPLCDDFAAEKVPPNSVFVMGDLRSQNPSDVKKRRSWGIIPLSSIKGRAKWVWLSIEPQAPSGSPHFPRFRFERMFRSVQ